MSLLLAYLPSLLLAILLGVSLWAIHWALIGRHREMGDERKFPRQLVFLGLILVTLLAFILVLPIEESSRNQLIALIGLLVSGTIAFSSTNILANLMGGILLRATKPFRIGDFIRVDTHFGRVTERGLFDTEIQTESRELISLPNSFLTSRPITTTRRSGAIVTVKLSLGYDIHHLQAEPLLLSAAEASGLRDPWVQVMDLGNFAITYHVSGLLEDTEKLVTARSNLCRAVLDTLHGSGLEIMSPNFMNQRPLADESKTIPKHSGKANAEYFEGGEHIVFDKAKQAQQNEQMKQELLKEIEELSDSVKQAEDDEEKNRLKKVIESKREQFKSLEQSERTPEDKKNA